MNILQEGKTNGEILSKNSYDASFCLPRLFHVRPLHGLHSNLANTESR